MARTNSNFNLSKDTKRVLGTFLDKNERSIYKRAMVDAEHSYTVNRHRKIKDNTASEKE